MCSAGWFLLDCSWAIGWVNPPAYFLNNTVAVLITFKSLPTSDFSAWLICSNMQWWLQWERARLFSTRRLKAYQGILNWLTNTTQNILNVSFQTHFLSYWLTDRFSFQRCGCLCASGFSLSLTSREQWGVSSVNLPGLEEIPAVMHGK